MSTTDGAIDQKSFYDLEGIYYCLLPKTDMEMKYLASTKFIYNFQHKSNNINRYSSIINNLKYE